MENIIHTYALVKSLCDKGDDYIDSFWPFTIQVFPSENLPLELSFIQSSLKENFALEIPLHTLKTILTRAKKKDYIKVDMKKYQLTKKGLEFRDSYETPKEVDRRLNSLFTDVNQFLTEKGISTSIDLIENNFLIILQKNLSPLLEFFNPNKEVKDLELPKEQDFNKYLIEYMKSVEQHNPEHYQTLLDMYYGSIISTIICPEESDTLYKVRATKFKHCHIFFDSNLTFSILGLHPEEFNYAAKELFGLLKKYEFKLHIFNFTIDEMCRYLNGYEEHRFPQGFRIDSLHSNLKINGWKKSDVKELIMNMENKINDVGIEIEWVKNIDLSDYTPSDNNLRELLKGYKPFQSSYHQNHDLLAIEKIKEFRGKSVRSIEDSKYCFLSSDRRLSKFNFIEFQHRRNGTVSEVISDILLTNILWLKNPNLKLSLSSIIAAHSRDLFVKRRVWEQFYKTVKKMKQEEKVGDKEISALFYNNYIEEVLIEFEDKESSDITEEFILEKIEEATKFTEKEKKREIEKTKEELEKDFILRIEKEISKTEEQKENVWLEKVQNTKAKFIQSSESYGKKFSFIYATILTASLLGMLISIFFILKDLGFENLYIFCITILLGGSGIFGIWKKIRNYLKKRLFEASFSKKIRLIEPLLTTNTK